MATVSQCAEKDAPEWKKYSEDFIDKMAWMQDVTTEKLGPSLWHMHPLMFLGALRKSVKVGWAHSKFGYFLGKVESKTIIVPIMYMLHIHRITKPN